MERVWLAEKSIFVAIGDYITLFKEVGIKQGSEPWITTDMFHLCSERDKVFSKFRILAQQHLHQVQ